MIFNKNGRTIQFIHIPKTAGTSIRKLIAANGWQVDSKTDYYKSENYIQPHPHHTRDTYAQKKQRIRHRV